MPGPSDPIERLIRDQLRLQRIANGLSAEATQFITAVVDEAVAAIARHDPTNVSARRYQLDRIQKVVDDVATASREGFEDWHRQLRRSLAAVGREQSLEARALLLASVGADNAGKVRGGVLTQNQVRTILDTNPFEGKLLREWVTGQADLFQDRTLVQLRRGVMEGDGIDGLTARIRGGRHPQTGQFIGGVKARHERDAVSIIRTAVTQTATDVRRETLGRNRSVTQAYQFVATLDSRTSEPCMAADGQVFGYDDPDRLEPPLHFSCRSTIVPVIGWESMGVEPPEEGDRFARDPETGRRSDVPASTDYGGWLRQQDPDVVRDILGRERGDLFLRGEISTRDLVRGDGSIVPVSELRSRAA
jgi:SPP1 gp7 family putative phage head morphogenesis protein